MQLSTSYKHQVDEIGDLFMSAFTAAEGAQEGALIQRLVHNLLTQTPPSDIHVFTATEGKILIGGAVFTRLVYAQNSPAICLLSPMAVAPAHQRQGVGQALLHYALAELRIVGIDIAVTYGDPNYYKKVGFKPVSEDVLPAPLPLSQPEGWIAQSLTEGDIPHLAGPSACVAALNNPHYW